jgi:hypothetical protein
MIKRIVDEILARIVLVALGLLVIILALVSPTRCLFALRYAFVQDSKL